MNCRLLSIILLASGMLLQVHPEHHVGGILKGKLHWKAKSGPYLVESDILIPRFCTLEIDSGTRVEIAPGPGTPTSIPQLDQADSGSISIKVEGILLCRGTKTKPVRFVPPDFSENCSWYGIVFRKPATDSSSISGTEISGAYNGITIQKCRPTIKNSIIERNNIGINCLTRGSGTIANCIITGNFTAAVRIQDANPMIVNSIILHNRGYGFWGDGVSAATVACNCFFDNTDGNFQDCDPALGRLVVKKKKKKGAPADTFANLLCDPIIAGTEADLAAAAKARSAQPAPRKILKVKLPRFLQPASPFPARNPTQTNSRYALSPFSPCIGAGKAEDGSAIDIGLGGK